MATARALDRLIKKFQPEEIIFREGDLSNDLYILKVGKVGVFTRGDKIAEVDEAGTYLGEMSALLGEPRTATLKAETSCEFYVVPGSKIFRLIMESPTIGIKLLGIIADRLRNTNKNVVKKEQEKQIIKEKYEKLHSHYKATAYLYAKANKLIQNELLKAIHDYAESIEPVEKVTLKDFEQALLTIRLRQLLGIR